MRRILIPLTMLPAALLAVSTVLAAHTVTVWSGDMDGWAFHTSAGGSPPDTAVVSFVAGPGTPPLGTGSVQLSVGANGAGAAEVHSTAYGGTPLADLTALTYWTHVSVPGSGGQAPYIILSVDLDNDGTSDDLLFFEPAYQDGTHAGDPVPNQGSVAVGTWQDWDASTGGWWSLNAGAGGPPLVTLDTYVAANPDATIVNSASGLGGLRFVAGFGAGAWDSFVGNVDAVVIGTTGHTTTYDFEVAPAATPTPTSTAVPMVTATPAPSAEIEALPDTAAEHTADLAGLMLALIGANAIGVALVHGRRRASRGPRLR